MLFVLTAVLPLASAVCFRYAFHPHCRPLLVLGVLGAGIAGSSVSIMRRMPEFEVRLSNELDAYRRKILSRMGVGIAASLIGTCFLGVGCSPGVDSGADVYFCGSFLHHFHLQRR
jgi:hypothetical protein